MSEHKPQHNHDVYNELMGSVSATADKLRASGMLLPSDQIVLQEENEALKEGARYDEMTGLLNRYGMVQEIQKILELPEKKRKNKYIVFADLDGFKNINDTKGHAAGDAIIRAVADRFRVRKSDTAGRFGGDEFVAILDTEVEEQERRKKERSDSRSRREENMSPEDMANAAKERLRAEIEEVGREKEVPLSASIGVVRVNGHSSVEEILGLSDEAMYKDKLKKPERLERLSREINGGVREEEVVSELEVLGSEIDVSGIVKSLPKATQKVKVEYGGKKWNVLPHEAMQLGNVLTNLGMILSDSKTEKARGLTKEGLDQEEVGRVFADEYPILAERTKQLFLEEQEIIEGLRAKDDTYTLDDLNRFRESTDAERQVLTSYLFWKITEDFWNRENGAQLINTLKS